MLPIQKGQKDCVKWLESRLRCGITLCENTRAAAQEAGFTGAELKAARKALGVKTWHQVDRDASIEHWFWYLPEEET